MDTFIFAFLLLGLALGAWRGVTKATIIAFSTYLPIVISIYFFDDISNFVDIVIANSGNSNTAAIGALGAFSGLISFAAILVGVFLLSRFLIAFFGTGEVTIASRISGAFVGIMSQNIALTLAYFLMYTALPAETTKVMHQTSWTKLNWPIHKVTFPMYQEIFSERTARFGESVASLGIATTLIRGTGEFELSKDLSKRLKDPKISAMIAEAQRLATNLDVAALQKQLNKLKTEDLTAENIDRMIKAEDLKRRQFLESQLATGQK